MIQIIYTGILDESILTDEHFNELSEIITESIKSKIHLSEFDFLSLTTSHSDLIPKGSRMYNCLINLTPKVMPGSSRD